MIGGLILEICLEHNSVGQITSLVRSPTEKSHSKLNEVVLEDLSHFEPTAAYLKDQDVAFYCLGVYTGAVPREVFRQITVDYPVNFGRVLHQNNPNLNFCLLSGAGADRSEKSKVMFALDKGIAENQMAGIGFKEFHAFRPGYIYPVSKRKEPNISYEIMRALYPIIRLFGDKMSIKSTELAQSMFHVGMNGCTLQILENDEIIQQLEADMNGNQT